MKFNLALPAILFLFTVSTTDASFFYRGDSSYQPNQINQNIPNQNIAKTSSGRITPDEVKQFAREQAKLIYNNIVKKFGSLGSNAPSLAQTQFKAIPKAAVSSIKQPVQSFRRSFESTMDRFFKGIDRF